MAVAGGLARRRVDSAGGIGDEEEVVEASLSTYMISGMGRWTILPDEVEDGFSGAGRMGRRILGSVG